MARLRRDFSIQLIALLALAWAAPTFAQEAPEAEPAGLYDRPTLVLDPDMHTGRIRADVDAEGRYAVTGSIDKTVRVWSIGDGRLLRTIRLPAGPGNVGKVYAVAISPEGELIAAGGWTRWTEANPQQQIYLFDRATGTIVGRIDGLPETVKHLTFSHDGRYLAAMLGESEGLRVYDRYDGWAEVARDTYYGDSSYGATFSADGRLATTSFDGRVRLYNESFELVASTEPTGGPWLYGIAFSPDGAKLAVGHEHTTAVNLLDGRTLAPLPGPDIDGINNDDFMTVTWSADGAILFAGGHTTATEPLWSWCGPTPGQGAAASCRPARTRS
jgi:WD40 repeat protein